MSAFFVHSLYVMLITLSLDLEREVEEGNDTVTKYVRIFGIKSFLAAAFALLVVFGLF